MPHQPGSPGFPDGVVVASRDAWRNRFYKDALAKEPKATEDALSRRFRRAATELKEAGKIGECGQWVWLDMDKAGHGQNWICPEVALSLDMDGQGSVRSCPVHVREGCYGLGSSHLARQAEIDQKKPGLRSRP